MTEAHITEYKAIAAASRVDFEKLLNQAAAEGWQMHSYAHHGLQDPHYKYGSVEGWSAVMLRDLPRQ